MPDHAVVIGEALIDVVRTRGGEVRHVGGSPANVASGLARLERPVELVTQLADDQDGEVVRRHLSSAGLKVTVASPAPDRTSKAIASISASGNADYAFDFRWSPTSIDVVTDPCLVHTGSLAAVLDPALAVEGFLGSRRGRCTISYDPNIRPMLLPDRRRATALVERLVTLSDVVKLSEEDANWLAPGLAPEELARRWLGLGPALVVVTLGRHGALALTEAVRVHVPAPAVTVIDTIGAGDSFQAGLLDALWGEGLVGGGTQARLRMIDTPRLTRIVTHAARAAAITVSRSGAQLPRRAELGPAPST